MGSTLAAIGVFVYFGYQPEPPASFVRQWTEAIDALLVMQPIYPLREDVQVGDIYLSVDQSAVAPQLVAPRKIGHVDVTDLLQQYYKSRPQLPQLVADKPADLGSTVPTQPMRLRQVAIPGFRVLRTDERSGFGRASGRLFGFNLGSHSANSTTVSISLSAVQELTAPDDNVMIDRIVTFCHSPEGFLTFNEDRLRFSLGQIIDVTNREKLNSARPSIFIISRVLYAGAIDLAISDATVLSGSSRDEGGPKIKADKASETNGQGGDGSNRAAGETERHESLTLEAKALGVSMGITANLAFGDRQTMVLRQTFDVPMAFAFGGISVKAMGEGALKNCELVKASAGAASGRFLSGGNN